MEITDENSPFTTHEIQFLKNIGEYDNIMAGLQFIEDAKKFPKDLPAFLQRFNKEIPDDPEQAFQKFDEIEKNEPEFFEEIIAYFRVMNDMKPQEKKVEKVSIKQMKEQEIAEAYEILAKKLKSI